MMCFHGLPSTRRRGYTLIEILIVIGLSSIVLSSVAVTLHVLQRLTHQMRNELPQTATLTQLTLRLRADAHSAVQFAMTPTLNGGTLARFTQLDETVIVYEPQSSHVVRRVTRNDQQVRQELFRLLDRTEVSWSTDQEPPTVVTLLLRRNFGRISDATDAVHVVRIDAALGITSGAGK